MKQFDDVFDALYLENETEPDCMEDGEWDVMNTYQNVLRKAGLEQPAPRVRRRGPRVLLVAAVAAAGVFMAAAAVYRVSDVFRGVLDIHDSAEAVYSSGAIVDRTGMLIDNQKNSDGVKLTLRAAVGDERILKVLVDVEDATGTPLALTQRDGSLSREFYSLRDFWLRKADGSPIYGSIGCSFIDDDPTDNKFTVLFTYTVSGDTIRGEQLHLHFEDIEQSADLAGIPLDMEPDYLYRLLSRFGPLAQEDFYESGGGSDGTQYLLDAGESDLSLPLSSAHDEIRITHAGVRDGVLYLQGTAPNNQPDPEIQSGSTVYGPIFFGSILDNPALVNPETGHEIVCWNAGWSNPGTGDCIWTMRFEGVESLEDLKGYVWYYNAGDKLHVAHEGSWDFTFTVDIEDVDVRLKPDVETLWDGYAMTVTQVDVSPYSLYLVYEVDEATARRMFPLEGSSDWYESAHPVTITMRDGSTVAVGWGNISAKGGGGISYERIETAYEMLYELETVIDPGQIAAIQLGDQTIYPQE